MNAGIDGVPDSDDSCPYGGANTDGRIDLSDFGKQNDISVVNSDVVDDNCGDEDDDNDGLSDAEEAAGCSGQGPTSSVSGDSDGDLFLDGAECALGTNPSDYTSRPSFSLCGPAGDGDADGLSDRNEFCKFNSNPGSLDTDADGCRDDKEVAPVNSDLFVNAADLGLVASNFGAYAGSPEPFSTPPPYPIYKVVMI